MSDSECLIVAECLRWWRSSRYKVLFSPCSHFTDENYSVVFDTAHAHTKRNSESIHSCSTGSIPCFLLAFPHEHLAYWWPLIPHGKTHHEENETNWGWNKKKKEEERTISLISYQQTTMDRVNERFLNCFHMSSGEALQLRFQLVWLTEQQISNSIESLQRPGLQGFFEIGYSWWNLRRKLGGKCLKCFTSLGWNESGFIRSP